MFYYNFFFAGCSVGFYGYKCKKRCECKFPNMDKECDFRYGECYCEPGFTSEYCNQSMSYYNQIVFNQQSDIFIVKGSVSRFDTSYHVSPLFFIVPKPIESELITLIGNFPWKKLWPVEKRWSVVAIYLIRILLYFPTPFHHSIALFMNHSHATRKLVSLFRINPLALRYSVVTKINVGCVHPSKCSVKFGNKLQIVAQ